jgi:hypothetical protein
LPEGPRSAPTNDERLYQREETHSTQYANRKKTVVFDIWGLNAFLTKVEAEIAIQFFEISTGKLVKKIDANVQLLPNRSTELANENSNSSIAGTRAAIQPRRG